MKSKPKPNKAIIYLIILFVIAALFYFYFQNESKPKEPMQDYTWQQVAFVGVIMLGVATIIHSLRTVIIYKGVKVHEIQKV